MERVEELTKDKVCLVEEYEAKLAKAQECYERELEAMRRTHQLTTENLLAWKRTEVNSKNTSHNFCGILARSAFTSSSLKHKSLTSLCSDKESYMWCRI